MYLRREESLSFWRDYLLQSRHCCDALNAWHCYRKSIEFNLRNLCCMHSKPDGCINQYFSFKTSLAENKRRFICIPFNYFFFFFFFFFFIFLQRYFSYQLAFYCPVKISNEGYLFIQIWLGNLPSKQFYSLSVFTKGCQGERF